MGNPGRSFLSSYNFRGVNRVYISEIVCEAMNEESKKVALDSLG